ncbi:hypothetical protein K435DRAFT_807868 [Dendrothele bispora CBS 962.96]|uniref:Uncharacterized protein n=1 Tax=Dendrothele bispora (strain CBS 962.96) TaxID=1314807 RepID=A0A4S8L372_DENBC|nr:hypothetical protein K435DRAFT_807868 [Dendrothele bispora CBS 962.96]
MVGDGDEDGGQEEEGGTRIQYAVKKNGRELDKFIPAHICSVVFHWGSTFIRHSDELRQVQESIFEATSRNRKIIHTLPRIHYISILDGTPIVTMSPISTLLIATSDTSQFDGFPRPGHLESKHCKRILVRIHKISLTVSYHPSIRINLKMYSGTSHRLDFVNNYGSVHADEGLIGAWREEKNGQEG